jgi:hypothetical protein
MRVYWIHFNFCRDHRGLKNEEGILENKTPAKEYGITENKWTLTKLLNYRCSKISTN